MKRLQISISSSRVGSSSPMMRGSLPRPEWPVRRACQRGREFFSFPFFFLFFSLFLSSPTPGPGRARKNEKRAGRLAKLVSAGGGRALREGTQWTRRRKEEKRHVALRCFLVVSTVSNLPFQHGHTSPNTPEAAAESRISVHAGAHSSSFFIECLGACTFHTRHL